MAIALVFFVAGRKYLGGAGDVPPNPLTPQDRPKVVRLFLVVLLGVALAVAAGWIVEGGFGLPAFIDAVSYLAFAAPVATFIVMFRSPKVNAHERTRLRAYIPLFVAAMIFWMIFEQAASTLAVVREGQHRPRDLRGRPSRRRSSSRSTPRRSSCSHPCSRGCGSSSTTARRRP